MTTALQRFFRSRAAWPVAIGFASLALFVNEASYRSVFQATQSAAEINTSRMAIQRVMIEASDIEMAYRGIVRAGDNEFRERFNVANLNVQRDLAMLEARYNRANAHAVSRETFRHLNEVFSTRRQEIQSVLAMQARGERSGAVAALDAEVAKQLHLQVSGLGHKLLALEEQRLLSSREQLLNTLDWGRWSIGILTIAALIGVGIFRNQSMRIHRASEDHRRLLESEKTRLERAVDQRTQELRALTRHLQSMREGERGALARELHDELGALLTAAKLDVARLKSRLPQPSEEVQERMAHLTTTLNEGIALKRRIIEDLRPSSLNNLGLVAALEMLCRETQEGMGIPIQASLDPVDLTSEGALTVYRFVQEALTNVAKYARASSVQVLLRQVERRVQITVQDDGIGFDTKAIGSGHHGLSGMHFRVESHGGAMLIESRPGLTRLTAEIPSASGDDEIAPP